MDEKNRILTYLVIIVTTRRFPSQMFSGKHALEKKENIQVSERLKSITNISVRELEVSK